MSEREVQPLLPRQGEDTTCRLVISRSKRLLVTIFVILVLIVIGTSLCFVLQHYLFPDTPDIPEAKDVIDLNLLSLSVWGSPASFGVLDKEQRMEAIGQYLSNNSYDVVLLQELWMRPDHQTIKSHLPDGYQMSDVGDLAPAVCDGRVAPTFCSGLAVATKLPVKEFKFTSFSVHGSIWSSDGEFWVRKGIGRVRLEPAANLSVDILVSSLCAEDTNSYYRQIQAQEFGEALRSSDADFVLAGGNFEVDPRTSETTYRDVSRHMKDTKFQYFGHGWLNPNLATYGNAKNSYTSKYSPLHYDYLLHRSNKGNQIIVRSVEIPVLKAKSGISLSNHEASVAAYTLKKTTF